MNDYSLLWVDEKSGDMILQVESHFITAHSEDGGSKGSGTIPIRNEYKYRLEIK